MLPINCRLADKHERKTIMTEIRINENIAFLRKQRKMTQESLANALGVTNQAVSKWESNQCCPDIQLLPEIAKLFNVSVDELMGYRSAPQTDDIILSLREKTDSLPEGEDYDFAFGTAAALHAAVISKKMTENENPNTGWVTEDAIEHAAKAEWGWSCCNCARFTTAMQAGTVIFSNNDLYFNASRVNKIIGIIKPLSDRDNFKIAAALWKLTQGSAEKYASAEQISLESGIAEKNVLARLSGDISFLFDKKSEGETLYSFSGPYISIFPALFLLSAGS